MTMDVFNGGLTLAQAARELPGKPSPSTVWRWCRRGVNGVRLEYRRVGRNIITNRAALQRFIDELTRRDAAPQVPPPKPSGTRGRGTAENFEAEAETEGL